MENPKISEEARDKYIDATVAVFMDQYAAALDEAILEEMAVCSDNEFPPELDKRCLALIEKECAKQCRVALVKNILHVGRSAAIIVVALLGLCSVLFMTVEAFRVPVINFFVQETDNYIELSGVPYEEVFPSEFNENDPLAGILPSDFVLTNKYGSWELGLLTAEYSNEMESTVYFSIMPADSFIQLDTENAQVTTITVYGHTAYLCEEGSEIRISWLDELTSRSFSFCTTNISKDTVLAFAESTAKIFA